MEELKLKYHAIVYEKNLHVFQALNNLANQTLKPSHIDIILCKNSEYKYEHFQDILKSFSSWTLRKITDEETEEMEAQIRHIINHSRYNFILLYMSDYDLQDCLDNISNKIRDEALLFHSCSSENYEILLMQRDILKYSLCQDVPLLQFIKEQNEDWTRCKLI